MSPLLVLCLGNEVLSDDSFGFHVARRLSRLPGLHESAEIIYSSIAGFALLDLLKDRRRVLVVDTIQTGASPGTLHFFPAGNLTPSQQLINSHQISLPTALSLAARFGIDMPECIDVLAVEAQDIETLSESMTPRIAQAVNPAIDQIEAWVRQSREELKIDSPHPLLTALG